MELTFEFIKENCATIGELKERIREAENGRNTPDNHRP